MGKQPGSPSYQDLVIEAIKALNERNGSSRYAINQFIQANHANVASSPAYKHALANALKKGVDKGIFIMIGASYKLNKAAVKPKKPVKKASAKKPKASAAAKKPAAKKSAAKKPAAKKAEGKPKKAASKKGEGKPKAKKAAGAKKTGAKKAAGAKKTGAKKAAAKKTTKK